MAIQVGTGSWADADYVGLLYPRGLPPDMRLSAYASWFGHVEVNATYYSTPKKEQVKQWIEKTPPGFLFDIRLHRAFSQSPVKAAQDKKRLKYVLSCLQPLFRTGRFGTFLLVLSPNFKPGRRQLSELDGLVEKLRPHPLAVELRHSDWVSAEALPSTLAYFRAQNLTWVAVDMPRIEPLMPPIDEVTNPKLAYLRLHGRNPRYFQVKSAADRHAYSYTETEIDEIAGRIQNLSAHAENVRVLANNHYLDFAPRTALALKERLNLF